MKTRLCCGAGEMCCTGITTEHMNLFISNIEVELIYSCMVNIQIILYINECMFLIDGPCCKVAVCSPDLVLNWPTVQLCVCVCVCVHSIVNE